MLFKNKHKIETGAKIFDKQKKCLHFKRHKSCRLISDCKDNCLVPLWQIFCQQSHRCSRYCHFQVLSKSIPSFDCSCWTCLGIDLSLIFWIFLPYSLINLLKKKKNSIVCMIWRKMSKYKTQRYFLIIICYFSHLFTFLWRTLNKRNKQLYTHVTKNYIEDCRSKRCSEMFL